jgi:hypothetical protein
LKRSKTIEILNSINWTIKTYMELLLIFIDDASSLTLAEKLATHDYEKYILT